jgi:ABC-type Na+ efflux pump permease subunit
VYVGVLITSWIPADNAWVAWLRLENLSSIIMSVFNNAGTRAMMIGIAIGVAATSLKILVGLDRSYLGQGD